MIITKEKLVEKYARAICKGHAAIFAGAGMSVSSGCITWKKLLQPLAEELGINIDKENDLLMLAQYYRNETGTRASINDAIMNSFQDKDVTNNINMQIVTCLPISTYWTTNYDKLIEKGLELAGRKADVKSESKQLATTFYERDVVVYKMHGDVENPADAVLTKDDYVWYREKRPYFQESLVKDLMSKRFLFLGFSFDDPNFDFIINQMHVRLGDNLNEHYWITREVKKEKNMSEDDYKQALKMQELRIKDLSRYGVQVVLMKEYDELTGILQSIESAVKTNNVFISGSAYKYDPWTQEEAEELVYEIAQNLIKENFRITTGVGVGIGTAVISGALEEIYGSKRRSIDKYLCLRPFPYTIKDKDKRKKLYTKYREDIIKDTGIAIFLFGNKVNPLDPKEAINADGCLQEFKFAKENGNIIIPIGSTGYAAKQIFDEIKGNIEKYPYLKDHIDRLETEKNKDKLIEIIMEIVKEQRITEK